jgi:O-succinylbenzoate synthase
VDELLERVARYLEDGYQRVKIKIQPGWDVEPVQRVHERFPDTPLMVDANAAYTIADLDVFRELDRFELMMYEQPLGRHALGDMAELARSVKTPVCADESAESLEMLEKLIELRAASIVNIKIQRVGGIHNARRMHDRCLEAGLPCWAGTMPELWRRFTLPPCRISSTRPMWKPHRDGTPMRSSSRRLKSRATAFCGQLSRRSVRKRSNGIASGA